MLNYTDVILTLILIVLLVRMAIEYKYESIFDFLDLIPYFFRVILFLLIILLILGLIVFLIRTSKGY